MSNATTGNNNPQVEYYFNDDQPLTFHSNKSQLTYYFAARYDHNALMRTYRDELETKLVGSKVNSAWIDLHGGQVVKSFDSATLDANPDECWQYGNRDLNDMIEADTIVNFTTYDGGGKGGRHVEFGVAMVWSKRLVIVGPRENVFHTHPKVEVYPRWKAFLEHELENMAQIQP